MGRKSVQRSTRSEIEAQKHEHGIADLIDDMIRDVVVSEADMLATLESIEMHVSSRKTSIENDGLFAFRLEIA